MMRKNLLLLAATGLALALASGPASALTISATSTQATSDNDDDVEEDASSTSAWVGLSSYTIADTVASTAAVERRTAGQAAAWEQDGSITQSVDQKVTWTVTPGVLGQVYNVTFSPNFHGLLKLTDDLADEAGDQASFSNLLATLKLDGSSISDTLDLAASTSRSTAGSTAVDKTASQTLTGLTGTHTFELRYTGSFVADATDNGFLCGDLTAAAALWGQDGSTANTCSSNDGFATYTSGMSSDGLFMKATVTITTVPEPGTLLLLGAGLLGLAAQGRKRA